VWLTELQILGAKTSPLHLKKVNATYVDLTLRCVGELKSQPVWKHNGTTVSETVDTVLNTVLNKTSRRRTVIITRENVAESFAGYYQCVDTAFIQSDSDIVMIHADIPTKSQLVWKQNDTTVIHKGTGHM